MWESRTDPTPRGPMTQQLFFPTGMPPSCVYGPRISAKGREVKATTREEKQQVLKHIIDNGGDLTSGVVPSGLLTKTADLFSLGKTTVWRIWTKRWREGPRPCTSVAPNDLALRDVGLPGNNDKWDDTAQSEMISHEGKDEST